jgi:NAD(P)-dependent dehydrogenase (short-subunit alcohol dehydrogenase family)
MDLGLKGKRALVTGGSSGIGLAVAQKLAEEGCAVAICGRGQGKIDAAVAKVPGSKGFAADVSDAAQVAKLVEDTANALGGLDIVVSNAGTHLAGRIADVSGVKLQQHFNTKVVGAYELARNAAPHMKKQGGGRFIVIIGQAGKVPQANVIVSNIVNTAQHALVKSLSDELAPSKILVNAVCPSRIKSPLTDHLTLYNEVHLGRSLEQQESRWGAEVPMGHWGSADDIANAVVFLASSRAQFIDGTNIDVDGGHQRMIF